MVTSLTNVLIWENDPGTGELLNSILEPQSFQLTHTASEADGLLLARRISPDVVILVLDGPNDEGLATCAQFRRACDAPILVLSSNGRPNFAEQVLDAGADDYLVKPITGNLITASLNKLARRARAEREASKCHDDPTL